MKPIANRCCKSVDIFNKTPLFDIKNFVIVKADLDNVSNFASKNIIPDFSKSYTVKIQDTIIDNIKLCKRISGFVQDLVFCIIRCDSLRVLYVKSHRNQKVNTKLLS